MQRQASIAVLCSDFELAEEITARLTRGTPTEISLVGVNPGVESSFVTATAYLPAQPHEFGNPTLGAQLCWGANAQILVIDSSAGIDSTTISFALNAMHHHPSVIVITGLNHPGASFDETVAVCQRVFGEDRKLVPISLPVLNDHEVVQGSLELISECIVWRNESGNFETHDLDPEHFELVEQQIDELLNAVAITSEDPGLADSIISSEGIDPDSIFDEIVAATIRLELVPIISVQGDVGIELLAHISPRVGVSNENSWSPTTYLGEKGVLATVLPNDHLRVWQGGLQAGTYLSGTNLITMKQIESFRGRPTIANSESPIVRAVMDPRVPAGSTISDSGYEITFDDSET